MNTLDSSLKFDIKLLLVRTMHLYDHNNNIKISDFKKDKSTALSLTRMTE